MSERTSERSRGLSRARTGVVAAVLLIVGIVALVVWKVESGNEALPYSSDAAPPAPAHVTAYQTYQLAVPGGVPAMRGRGIGSVESGGVAVIDLQCSYTTASGQRSLSVTAEATDTKAEDVVGEFVAPTTGSIQVDCDGWGPMYVPDADNRPYDVAGFAVLVSMIALSLGVGLALAVAYRSWAERRSSDLVPEATSADS